jgi:hypothetical protein
MAMKYVKIDGIIENQEGSLTLLSVGKFNTYEDALIYKKGARTFRRRDARSCVLV